jgi:type I restriction enzyme S subunit
MQGNIPYYGASGVIDYVDDYLFDDELILLAEDGENLLSRNLPIAFKISGKAWVNNHAHVLKPRQEFDIDYLVEYFERLNYEPFVTGSAQPKLTQTNMEMLSVPKPPEEEQAEISSVLTSVSVHKNRSEQYKEKLQRLKQGLMQDLLSGEVRTHDKDIEPVDDVLQHG